MQAAIMARPITAEDMQGYSKVLEDFANAKRRKIHNDLKKIKNLYKTRDYSFRLVIEREYMEAPFDKKTFYFKVTRQRIRQQTITLHFEPNKDNFFYYGDFGCVTKMRIILVANEPKNKQGSKSDNELSGPVTKIKNLGYMFLVKNPYMGGLLAIQRHFGITYDSISKKEYKAIKKELGVCFKGTPESSTFENEPIDAIPQNETRLPYCSIQKIKKVLFRLSLNQLNTALKNCEKAQCEISLCDRFFEANFVSDCQRFGTMTREELENYEKNLAQN